MQKRGLISKMLTELKESDFQIELNPDFSEVAPACKKLLSFAKKHCSNVPDADNFELVICEALNNVIEHGHLMLNQDRVTVRLFTQDEDWIVTIIDSGVKYDLPQSAPFEEMVDVPLNDLPEGGLGWALIKSITKKVTLERSLGRNYLNFYFTT